MVTIIFLGFTDGLHRLTNNWQPLLLMGYTAAEMLFIK